MTEDKDPMQDAIKVLLDRMEAYPEEFMEQTLGAYREGSEGTFSRFWRISEKIGKSMRNDPDSLDPLWFLSDQERAALYEGMRAARRQTFVTEVMTTLVAPEEDIGKRVTRADMGLLVKNVAQQLGQTVSSQQYYAQQQLAQQQVTAEQARINALAAQNTYGNYKGQV